MELRYCEECGELIRLETEEPLSLSDHFRCTDCGGEFAPAVKAESEGQGQGAGGPSLLESTDLNLFSQKSVAIRKDAMSRMAPPRQGSRRVEAPVASAQSGSTRLRLVKNDPAAAPPATSAPPATEVSPFAPAGSLEPSKEARKIVFRCLHCRAPLSMRPVDQDSKLSCPHCGNLIYIARSGQLSKTPPSQAVRKGSQAVLKGSQAVRRETGSQRLAQASGSQAVRIAKPSGSQAVRRGTGSQLVVKSSGSQVARKGSQAVPKGLVRAGGTAGSGFEGSLDPGHGGEPSRDCGLLSENPKSSWPSRPASAFEEHMNSLDPNKTAFLCEEAADDLDGVLTGNELDFGAPAGKSPGNEALARLSPVPGTDEGPENPAEHVVIRPRRAATGGRPRWGQIFTRVVFLAVCLAGATSIVGMTLWAGSARAEATTQGEPSEKRARSLERFGTVGTQGIRRLLGD
jgi:predicted RNA-binding Zn-ribbon protein involved in translation (DUF1610 family)